MLYDNVKKICEEKGITIMQLEQELEFPRSYIYKWNNNEPGIRKVQKVADYLGVPIEKLLKQEVREVKSFKLKTLELDLEKKALTINGKSVSTTGLTDFSLSIGPDGTWILSGKKDLLMEFFEESPVPDL